MFALSDTQSKFCSQSSTVAGFLKLYSQSTKYKQYAYALANELSFDSFRLF